MSEPIRVLIVDDHPLIREGLAARIAMETDLEVCGEAADSDQALSLVHSTRPSVIIVDLALKRGNGLNLIKTVSASGLGARILVFSAYDEALFAERALRAGARGYINKQELQGSIVEAIRALLRGELYLSANMTERLTHQAVASNPASRGVEGLSDRELQIFQLIGRGDSTRSIAEQLHLSIHTIESHREKIRIKLSLRNGVELLQRAVQWMLENAP